MKRNPWNGPLLFGSALLCLWSSPASAEGTASTTAGSSNGNAYAYAYGRSDREYANVVVVARSGGNFSDPVTAVNSIKDASTANPYLVKIMPGVYPVTVPVVLPNGVDLEGSGEGVTEITSASIPIQPPGQTIYCDDGCPGPSATLVLSDGTAARDITVSNLSGQSGIAIFASGVVELEHLTAIARGQGVPGTATQSRDHAAVYGRDPVSKLTLDHVTAIAEDGAGNDGDVIAVIVTTGTSLLVRDSFAKASGGQYANAIAVALNSSGVGAIMNSVAEISSAGEAINANTTTSILGCRIVASGHPEASGVNGEAIVTASEIRASGTFAVGHGTRVAGSLIQGGIMDDTAAVVNCWNEAFQPIPNLP